MKIVAAGLFCSALAVPHLAAAQTAPVSQVPLSPTTTVTNTTAGPYIVPQVGVAFGSKLNNHPVSWGVGAGFDTGTPFRVEAEINWLSGPRQGVAANVDTTDLTFMVSGIYRFAGRRASPYVVAGVGGHHANVTLSALNLGADESATKLAGNFGVGLESMLTNRGGIRADLRYVTGSDFIPSYWRGMVGVLVHF